MRDLVKIGEFNFRFQCQPGCVACCTQTGEVYLNDEDLARIAAHLKLTPKKFQKRFAKREFGNLLLTTPKEKDCHFLEDGGCSIHEFKPVQCRTFPFWPDNVRDRRSWKALKSYCPGIGIGKKLDRSEVQRQAQECADAFPDG